MNLFECFGKLLDEYQSTLQEATIELRKARKREEQLRGQLESKTLLSNEEACAYLKRKRESLRYYREEKGLPYIRKGQDIWYIRGEIDDWLEKGKVNRHKGR